MVDIKCDALFCVGWFGDILNTEHLNVSISFFYYAYFHTKWNFYAVWASE